MAQLEEDGEFAEQLFVHGLGVQTAEGMAEWLHAKVRADLGIDLDQGRRYSWGYPACPDQSEHEKVFALLDAPSIGMRLSGGYAVEPEQSTVAIVAHHPQAVYFGMRSGFLPKDKAPDDIIAGSDRDPSLLDEDPPDGAVEAERRARGRTPPASTDAARRTRVRRDSVTVARVTSERPKEDDDGGRRALHRLGRLSCGDASSRRSQVFQETRRVLDGGAAGRAASRASSRSCSSRTAAASRASCSCAASARDSTRSAPSHEFERLIARAGAIVDDLGVVRALRRRRARAPARQLPGRRRASWRGVAARLRLGGAASLAAAAPARRAAAPAARPARSAARAGARRCQDRPSFSSAGIPMTHGGRDLDRLQDDPVAERVGLRDAVAAAQHGDAGRLEDAEVRRRRRQHGRHVDGEQHGRGGAERRRGRRARARRAARSRRATAAPTRRAARRPPCAPSRGWRKTARPARTRASASRACPVSSRSFAKREWRAGAQQRRREQHDREQQRAARSPRTSSASWWPRKSRTDENVDDAEHRPARGC